MKSLRAWLIGGLVALLAVGIGLKAADLGNVIYSETDASNNASTLFPEGMAPSAVNDNARGFVGAVYRWYNHSQATTASTGSGGAFVLTYAVTPAAYATGDVYRFRANFTVTGTSTVNINGLGVRAITKGIGTTALIPDDIRSGQIVALSFDANTNTFQLQVPAGGGTFQDAMPTGGSSNAYTIGLSPAPTQYFTGMSFKFRASFSNTASASINVSGLGARSITVGAGATALQVDDIRSGQLVEVTYDPNTGTFQVQSPLAGGLHENGSYTPTIGGSTTAGTQTYSNQVGRYIRIGNLVTAWGIVTTTATDVNSVGNILIYGMPFTATTVANLDYPCAISNINGIEPDNSDIRFFGGRIRSNTSNIMIDEHAVVIQNPNSSNVPVTRMKSSVNVQFTCSYRIN